MNRIDETLTERNRTHGDFPENARISQALKTTMMTTAGWVKLSDVQSETLQLIALKISRILSGDPNEPDHWKDIQGYARLAEANPAHPAFTVPEGSLAAAIDRALRK